jgi:glycosyltransferase involved in cell wall biosynthesis
VQRLLILSPRELTRDVRVRRQAEAAVARGVEVVGLCAAGPEETPAALGAVRVVRVTGDRISGTLRRAGLGGMKPSRPLVRELRGLYRLLRLAKTTARLAAAARKLGRFDVVHANDLDALPAGWLAARRNGARLVYDAHELYTSMEPDPPRLYLAVVSRVEGALARRAGEVVTNCDLFADELERRLRLRRRPTVVLNCPDVQDGVAPSPRGDRLSAIYQAAVDHPGRPVSDVVAAAEVAPEVEFTLRLVHVDSEAVRAEIGRRGLGERVALSPPVGVEELVRALQGFDVGLIINRPSTPNDELAVPGKLFEYMMAGLAVVVPRLPGLAQVVEADGTGLTYEPGRPERLGAALAELARDRERLGAMQARARELALERYNAEAQARVLERVWAGSSSP